MTPNRSGFALIEKKEGVTSFEALSLIKKKVKPQKVGHTGTLDKFAQGLLIVVIGKFTKFASYITELGKEYIAEIEFGTETETLDPEGEVVYRTDKIPELPSITEEVENFIGDQLQIPPIYSALHVEGKRASALAREGKRPELKGRKICIYSADILDYSPPILRMRISCSKGTYIRALARDLGHACKSYAYVKKLNRVKVGEFSVEEAVSSSEFSPDKDLCEPLEFFRRLGFIHILRLKDEFKNFITIGKTIEGHWFSNTSTLNGIDAICAVFSDDDEFYALIEYAEGKFSYKFVGAPE